MIQNYLPIRQDFPGSKHCAKSEGWKFRQVYISQSRIALIQVSFDNLL